MVFRVCFRKRPLRQFVIFLHQPLLYLQTNQITAINRLSELSQLRVLNLSNTKVTAQGLLRGDLSDYQMVVVAFGQFSEKELMQLSGVINVEIGISLENNIEF